ncbi:MAG TPA: dihydropteroate synthase [Bacteroidales bacterium]|nr:dihydropteroate synthase [Bacteroidales bacterium]
MKTEVKDTIFSKERIINCRGRLLDLSTPAVMGILNITPDSFYDGGRYTNDDKIKQRIIEMVEQGADILDVGAYSSRPGAADIMENEEMRRLAPVLTLIRKLYPDIPVSVDTFRSGVARRVIKDFEADIINDISGGELDSKMFETAALLKVPYILMHMKGTPQNMTTQNYYENMLVEVMEYLAKKIEELNQFGVNDIIIDPGFGFAKNIEQNFQLLGRLRVFKIFEKPLLVGISRKSMIYKILKTGPEEALTGTAALNLMALQKGANILRVHDVKEAKQMIRLCEHLEEPPWLG